MEGKACSVLDKSQAVQKQTGDSSEVDVQVPGHQEAVASVH